MGFLRLDFVNQDIIGNFFFCLCHYLFVIYLG